MLRNILAVLGGILGGGILVGLIESLGHSLYSTTQEIDPTDIEAMTAFVQSLPFGALAIVIAAHALGAFMAGFFAARLSESNHFTLGLIAASFLLLGSLISLFSIPGHPLWMKIADPLLVVLLGWIGSRFGSGK